MAHHHESYTEFRAREYDDCHACGYELHVDDLYPDPESGYDLCEFCLAEAEDD